MLGAAASEAAAKQGGSARAASDDGGGSRAGETEDWAPIATQAITFSGPRGTLMGAWAPAPGRSRGAVLVIHENRGLTDHIRNVAGRFAAAGWSALALDLLSEEGGTGAFNGDEGAVGAALNAAPPERFDADMKAAVTELRRRQHDGDLAAIGFCFGGGMIWRLLAAGEARLDAAAPFYGPFPAGGDLRNAKAAVLGRVRRAGRPRQRDPPRGERRAARRPPQAPSPHVHRGRPRVLQRHRPRFNAPAAEVAWRRVILFEEYATRR